MGIYVLKQKVSFGGIGQPGAFGKLDGLVLGAAENYFKAICLP